MSVRGLPDRSVRNMATFMDKLHGMHQRDPLALEVCVRHVASQSRTSAARRVTLTAG